MRSINAAKNILEMVAAQKEAERKERIEFWNKNTRPDFRVDVNKLDGKYVTDYEEAMIASDFYMYDEVEKFRIGPDTHADVSCNAQIVFAKVNK